MIRKNNKHERVKINKQVLLQSYFQDFANIMEEVLNIVNESTDGKVEEVLKKKKYKYIVWDKETPW